MTNAGQGLLRVTRETIATLNELGKDYSRQELARTICSSILDVLEKRDGVKAESLTEKQLGTLVLNVDDAIRLVLGY